MKLIIASSLLFLSFVANAGGDKKHVQNHVEGTIVDQQTGEPLTGVKLTETLSGESIYTDFDGHFSIDFFDKDVHTIEISYISYEEKKIVIESNKSEDNVTIQLEGESLY